MKNKELIELYNSLSGITGLKGVQFNYAVSRNISKIKPEIESLQKSVDQSEEYKKFDLERIELVKKLAKKDEKGEPILMGNSYDVEDIAEFTKEFDILKSLNKDVIDIREKQLEEFNTLLEQENPIELYKIKLNSIPEEITTEQMKSLSSLIIEE